MRTFIVRKRAVWTFFITFTFALPERKKERKKRRFVIPRGWFKRQNFHFWVNDSCFILCLIQSFLLLTHWWAKLWCFFCCLLWDVFIYWLRPKEKQSQMTNERAKPEYKDVTKTGWPPYWGRIGLSTLSMFSSIIYKALQYFLKGAGSTYGASFW